MHIFDRDRDANDNRHVQRYGVLIFSLFSWYTSNCSNFFLNYRVNNVKNE